VGVQETSLSPHAATSETGNTGYIADILPFVILKMAEKENQAPARRSGISAGRWVPGEDYRILVRE